MFNTYSIYGLTARVPFPCAGLPLAPPGATPDVTVEDGPVPDVLPDTALTGPWWAATPARFLVQGGPQAGRFLIEDGRRVILARAPDARDEVLALRLLDAVLATVLHQRRSLVLHATAAITPAGAVVIAGASGAGKSTTLSALLARGCTMLADDITVLQRDARGGWDVLPGAPVLHLCTDAAEGLGQDIRDLSLNPWRRMKAAVPTHGRMADAPAPLRALFVMESHAEDRVVLESLLGADKFAALQQCLYGPLLTGEQAMFLPALASVAQQTDVVRLCRPAARWSVDEVALCVHNWRGGDHDH